MRRHPLQCFSLHMAQGLFDIQDWNKVGVMLVAKKNALILTHEQYCIGQGKPLLTQGRAHGMVFMFILIIESNCYIQHRSSESSVSSKCLISDMCPLWEQKIHNQNWQETTAMQKKVWDTQRFERGMEDQKWQQGRARKSRHDSLKTAWRKGGKPWKQSQTRSKKLKIRNRNYSLYLG